MDDYEYLHFQITPRIGTLLEKAISMIQRYGYSSRPGDNEYIFDVSGLIGQIALQTRTNTERFPMLVKSKSLLSQEMEKAEAKWVHAYFEAALESGRTSYTPFVPLEAEAMDPLLMKTMFGHVPVYKPYEHVKHQEGSLQNCLEWSEHNMQQMQQAIFFLNFLSKVLLKSERQNNLTKTISYASQILTQDKRNYFNTYMKIALIQGDPSVLQTLRERINLQHYGEGYAVSHLYTFRESYQSSGRTSSDARFRQEASMALTHPIGAIASSLTDEHDLSDLGR